MRKGNKTKTSFIVIVTFLVVLQTLIFFSQAEATTGSNSNDDSNDKEETSDKTPSLPTNLGSQLIPIPPPSTTAATTSNTISSSTTSSTSQSPLVSTVSTISSTSIASPVSSAAREAALKNLPTNTEIKSLDFNVISSETSDAAIINVYDDISGFAVSEAEVTIFGHTYTTNSEGKVQVPVKYISPMDDVYIQINKPESLYSPVSGWSSVKAVSLPNEINFQQKLNLITSLPSPYVNLLYALNQIIYVNNV